MLEPELHLVCARLRRYLLVSLGCWTLLALLGCNWLVPVDKHDSAAEPAGSGVNDAVSVAVTTLCPGLPGQVGASILDAGLPVRCATAGCQELATQCEVVQIMGSTSPYVSPPLGTSVALGPALNVPPRRRNGPPPQAVSGIVDTRISITHWA